MKEIVCNNVEGEEKKVLVKMKSRFALEGHAVYLVGCNYIVHCMIVSQNRTLASDNYCCQLDQLMAAVD